MYKVCYPIRMQSVTVQGLLPRECQVARPEGKRGPQLERRDFSFT